MKQRAYCCRSLGEHKGSVFAFPSDADKLDLLVIDNSKLVYKAKNVLFVSDKHRVVLKSPGQTAVSTSGKSIILQTVV